MLFQIIFCGLFRYGMLDYILYWAFNQNSPHVFSKYYDFYDKKKDRKRQLPAVVIEDGYLRFLISSPPRASRDSVAGSGISRSCRPLIWARPVL